MKLILIFCAFILTSTSVELVLAAKESETPKAASSGTAALAFPSLHADIVYPVEQISMSDARRTEVSTRKFLVNIVNMMASYSLSTRKPSCHRSHLRLAISSQVKGNVFFDLDSSNVAKAKTMKDPESQSWLDKVGFTFWKTMNKAVKVKNNDNRLFELGTFWIDKYHKKDDARFQFLDAINYLLYIRAIETNEQFDGVLSLNIHFINYLRKLKYYAIVLDTAGISKTITLMHSPPVKSNSQRQVFTDLPSIAFFLSDELQFQSASIVVQYGEVPKDISLKTTLQLEPSHPFITLPKTIYKDIFHSLKNFLPPDHEKKHFKCTELKIRDKFPYINLDINDQPLHLNHSTYIVHMDSHAELNAESECYLGLESHASDLDPTILGLPFFNTYRVILHWGENEAEKLGVVIEKPRQEVSDGIDSTESPSLFDK